MIDGSGYESLTNGGPKTFGFYGSESANLEKMYVFGTTTKRSITQRLCYLKVLSSEMDQAESRLIR